MKALFARKVYDIKELKELMRNTKKDDLTGTEYVVIREVDLSASEFEKFTQNFLEDQVWIRKDDGGYNEKGEIRCIRVVNRKTGEKILINTEGYDYPRYIAIEESISGL